MQIRFYILFLIAVAQLSQAQTQSGFPIPVSSIKMGGACCCGQFSEIFFPNLDFETGPLPPPGTFFVYSAGQNFGGWTVTRATIDHCDAGVGNLGAGNPNGASFFVDLHGSPGLGGISYDLFGLTPGNQYRIEFWTAQNGGGFSSIGNLKIAGGAWLDVSWTVSVSGAVAWRKESYEFMAMGANASMEFSSTGPIPYQGTLIDDIHIFECPGDQEDPVVNNPQDDLEVECDKDVPKAPTLSVSDNCDPNPKITFTENKQIIDACSKRITRTWTINDNCGNSTVEEQIIDVIDRNPPEYAHLPEPKTVYCDKDVTKEFNDWIKKNGNAIATDACGPVSWRVNYDRPPHKYCDTVLVEFVAIDHCGLESLEYANFVVADTLAPKFIVKAQSKNYICINQVRDSLRNWLNNFGFSKQQSDCDTIIRYTNFDGDSTKNPVVVTFYAKDRCGNIDSSKASFFYRSASDTFRITEYSCNFTRDQTDTISFMNNGCDSIVIHQKIKRYADSLTIRQFSCDPTSKLFDTLKLLNVLGCDSTVFFETIVKPIDTTRIRVFDCSFIQASIDTQRLSGQFCDSILLTEKLPLKKDSIYIQQTSCDSLATGVKEYHFLNGSGCDSLVQITTTYSGIISRTFTKNECGLLKNYTDTVVYSSSGCDSLVITNHIGIKLDTVYLNLKTCNLNQSGVDTFVYQTKSCDSTVIISTQFIPSDTTRFNQTSCDLNQVGIDSLIFTTSTCDSLVIINTTFIPSDTTIIQARSCDLNKVGIDTSLYATNTCDSLVIVYTQFIPADTTFIKNTSCDLTQTGLDTLIFQTQTCDSIIFIETSYVPSDTLYRQTESCLKSDEGLDTLSLKNTAGCDSLIITETRYKPLHLEFKLDSISCFNKADGRITILNVQDFQAPYQVFLDQLSIGQLNQLDSLKPGIHQIFIKDQRACLTDSIQFELQNPYEFLTDLGTNLEVDKSSLVQLDLKSNKNWQHLNWSPSNLITCFDCNPVRFQIEEDSWVYSLAIDERNCTSLDSIFIRVKKKAKVFVPNTFTPNGDNINDFFYIQGDGSAVVILLSIFDRWGNLVFEAKNTPANDPMYGWDGSYQSQKMNPAVFIYIAKVRISDDEKDIIEFKGDVNLLR